ncbi:MAG TPA: GNAT family N-acetyltransferase [Chloroflexota bacterium]|nr:GNAT family N-acetyltransferase [Chloroflexota bacterium]
MQQDPFGPSSPIEAHEEPIVVREARTQSDRDAVYHLTARVFSDVPGVPAPTEPEALAAATARWTRRIESVRAVYPVHIRMAVVAGSGKDDIVGSYVLYERVLRLGTHGEARLRTACIGVVLAHPDRRRAGIGRTLMRDAVRFARERTFDLLLLAGIPDFYHRFGYADVMEGADLGIDLAHLTDVPVDDSGVRVRPADDKDSAALLTLYERHYGAHAGGFARDLGEQELLASPGEHGPEYLLACDAAGEPCGYVRLRPTDRTRAVEAGANTWAAALALLRYQARFAEHREAAEEAAPRLRWRVPPDRHTGYLLAEHLPLTSEMRSRPRAGWLARPAHLPALFHTLAPALAARWERSGHTWTGTLTIQVEADEPTDQPGSACTIGLSPGKCEITAGALPHASATVRLKPAAFTQLIFGFRPLWWLAGQPGCVVPDQPSEARAAMETLFPHEPAWIAGSDSF